MTISEDRLLAYVDGLLSAEEAAAIERELAQDPDARTVVEALRASALPYRQAVEDLIPVPDLSDLERIVRRRPVRPTGRLVRLAGIAAAIVLVFGAGLIAGHYALPPVPPEKTQWARWVEDIAAYQALYTRETLSMSAPDDQRRDAQMARVSAALGKKIDVPVLSDPGAEFKYARMYAIDGEPLAQIAYLPAAGEPFSLCLMKTTVADHEPRHSNERGMNVATWRSGGIAYVLVGAVARPDMERYIQAFRRQQGA
ncbi:MAG: hypothetical protein WD470_03275 [Rhodospirillaceae bacterium]